MPLSIYKNFYVALARFTLPKIFWQSSYATKYPPIQLWNRKCILPLPWHIRFITGTHLHVSFYNVLITCADWEPIYFWVCYFFCILQGVGQTTQPWPTNDPQSRPTFHPLQQALRYRLNLLIGVPEIGWIIKRIWAMTWIVNESLLLLCICMHSGTLSLKLPLVPWTGLPEPCC